MTDKNIKEEIKQVVTNLGNIEFTVEDELKFCKEVLKRKEQKLERIRELLTNITEAGLCEAKECGCDDNKECLECTLNEIKDVIQIIDEEGEMNLKDARSQRRCFFQIKGDPNVMVNVDLIQCIEHKENKTVMYYENGNVSTDDANYDIYNNLGYLLVNDFKEVKAEKEQA